MPEILTHHTYTQRHHSLIRSTALEYNIVVLDLFMCMCGGDRLLIKTTKSHFGHLCTRPLQVWGEITQTGQGSKSCRHV